MTEKEKGAARLGEKIDGPADIPKEEKEKIRRNLEEVRREIGKALSQAGRSDPVTLLAATKTVPPEKINFAVRHCGLRCIGENRVQELLSKYDALDKENLDIHFIGSLQTNKVKYVIDKVSLIHSLDSVPLAREIDRQAKKRGIKMDVLVEINIGREENKGGILPEQIYPFLDEISTFDAICVKGIMTIAPHCEEKAAYLKFFEETYKIFIDISKKKPHNIDVSILSMGMSDSYVPALVCGSNLVRIGSAIFGHR